MDRNVVNVARTIAMRQTMNNLLILHQKRHIRLQKDRKINDNILFQVCNTTIPHLHALPQCSNRVPECNNYISLTNDTISSHSFQIVMQLKYGFCPDMAFACHQVCASDIFYSFQSDSYYHQCFYNRFTAKAIERLKKLADLKDEIIENYEKRHSKPAIGAMCEKDLDLLRNWKWDPYE